MKQAVYKSLFFLVTISISFGLCRCVSTFSPPVRALLSGSPARFEKGELEIGGGFYPYDGRVSYVPQDWVQLEMGVSSLEGVMGYAGPRFSLWPVARQTGDVKLLAETEIGLGFGAGGIYCGNDSDNEYCDGPGDMWEGFDDDGTKWKLDDPEKADRSWKGRFAYGGYAGIGIGIGVLDDLLDIYLKTRVQETKADGIPATFWFSGGVGLQVNVQPVKIYINPFVLHSYSNKLDAEGFPLCEFGLSVNYNVFH